VFSPNLMQAIVNYLITRPYNEVVDLINKIAQEDAANKVAADKAAADAQAKPVEPPAPNAVRN
jgi:hypothetical protein